MCLIKELVALAGNEGGKEADKDRMGCAEEASAPPTFMEGNPDPIKVGV